MQRAAFPLTILAALVLGFAGSQFVSTAQAQNTPSTAVCEVIPTASAKDATKWMNEQIVAGRTHFVTANVTFCAW